MQTGIGPIIKDDEIDLVALVKTIWAGRKTIYYSVAVAVVIGLIIAFTTTPKYSASATLLPSAEKKGGSLGGLSALAGMAGINIGAMMGDASGIPAELYPQVMQSYPFLNELVHQKYNFEKYNEPWSYYDMVKADTIETFGQKAVKYTFGLPWVIKEAIIGKEKVFYESKAGQLGVLSLSEEDLLLIKDAGLLLFVNVDKKTDLITISAETSEPVFTAQLVQRAVELLQKYVVDYKTQQSRQSLDFVQQSYDEKKVEYEQAQRNFLEYKDQHRNMVTERIDITYQQLSDRYDIASAVYKGLSQQLEQAKITVKEQTPAFTVMEPVKVPIEKSKPKKMMMLVISGFLGGFIGIGLVFVPLVLSSFKKRDEESGSHEVVKSWSHGVVKSGSREVGES